MQMQVPGQVRAAEQVKVRETAQIPVPGQGFQPFPVQLSASLHGPLSSSFGAYSIADSRESPLPPGHSASHTPSEQAQPAKRSCFLCCLRIQLFLPSAPMHEPGMQGQELPRPCVPPLPWGPVHPDRPQLEYSPRAPGRPHLQKALQAARSRFLQRAESRPRCQTRGCSAPSVHQSGLRRPPLRNAAARRRHC